ncbi:MAG: divergent polysaccharide deacetylase family protein [bacterium]
MKKNIFAAIAGLALFFLTGIVLAYIFGVSPPEPKHLEYPDLVDLSPRQKKQAEEAPISASSASAGRVAIVIDDLGWVTTTAPVFEQPDAQLTMGLMPGRPRSEELYRRWQDRYEFILHMPMEPLGYPQDDPGEYALFTDMSREQIRETIKKFLDKYPRIVGMNNHMGSAFTADRQGMDAVMELLAERGLFYLDSNTNSRSVAGEMARRHGVPFLKNQVFLDRETGPRYIDEQLKRLIELARRDGEAIGIGHIQAENTARVLAHRIPQYQQRGIEFVSLSEIVDLPELNYR